ncbi:MAG: putative lipid II flippase FtsW [Candidatus Colwellbacteria bacterium]|nr:putative lipid II flippase FtsW [Candidatus Colwellbacteria bacterium]
MSHTIDKPLLVVTLVLLVAGFLILASASMVAAQNDFGSLSYYALRQFLYGVLAGCVALLAASFVPYRSWKKYALLFMFFSFVLLALLFLPETSFSFGGARRWLRFGSLTFQPSEILKLSFIIYLASWLDERRRDVTSISYGMVPFATMLAIIGVFLGMQPDIGTLGIIVITSVFLYFIGGGRVSQIAAIIVFGLIIFYFLIQLAPYRMARITVFLQPGSDPSGVGYQIQQALIAIGSGGFFGLGFGKSLQKYNYLPEPMGDSIFAIAAEELGFVGVVCLILLFGFLFWRGIAIAKRAPDVFGKLLASGISIAIFTQAFINMAAILGLLPLTGIPLPFVSYGGTALAITLAHIGILLNISKHT